VAPFLIVDGDRNFREALAIALRLDGFDVRVAGSVKDAQRALAILPFTMVLVDLLLRGADEFLGQLAASACSLIVATGPHRELLDRAATRHRVRTLEKPFWAADLAAL
jgi:DNA-binding NtrC family response regulator